LEAFDCASRIAGVCTVNSLPHGRRASARRAPQTLTAFLVDLDVAFTDIVFQRLENGLEGLGARRRSALVDHAIEGVARPAAAAAERDGASDLFLVYVTGYADADRMDRDEDFDQRSVCYIATDRRLEFA
jgi:hypothetical protein